MTSKNATGPHRLTLPVILKAAQILTGLGTIAALALAVVAVTGVGAAVHTSRLQSAHDSCELLRGLVRQATVGNPAGRIASRHYIASTPLRNCDLYARSIVR